jgi:hypothetical protein
MTGDGQRADIAGAVALPIGILALILSMVPVLGLQVAWVPGAFSLILAITGLTRNRHRRGPIGLSTAALVVAIASFGISAAWLVLGELVHLFADHYTP